MQFAGPVSSLTMTTKTRHGKPPKLYATVKERWGDQWLVEQTLPVKRRLPDGGVRVQMEVVERTMHPNEIRPQDRKLVRPGDRLRLPAKRGPRMWGRAMTPKRKKPRYRFAFTLSAIEVHRVQS